MKKNHKELMRKIYTLLITLAALCFFGTTASATSSRTDATLSAAASTCTATGTVCLIVPVDNNQGGATFTISTNAGGNTIQFEASGDGGGTWVALSVTPSNSTTTVTSTTSTGVWQANVAGYTNVRMRMSTLSSGTNLVSIAQSSASARTLGGGGIAASVPFSGITGSTNTTAAMIVGTGASLAFTGTSTLDLSADTVATAFKVPVGAGFTSSANGVINYDSTAGNTHFRTAGADSLGVGEAAAIANGFLTMSTSATNSLIGATLCDQGITTANTLTCTNTAGLKVVNVQTGTSPPACTIGTGGAFCAGEGTAVTSAAAVDQFYADSTNHTWMASQNAASGGVNDTGGATFFPVQINYLSSYNTSSTLAPTDSAVLCNKATAITLTLPVTAIAVGKSYRIKEIGAGACTISPSSGNLDGATSLVLSQLYAAIDVVWDGTTWWIF